MLFKERFPVKLVPKVAEEAGRLDLMIPLDRIRFPIPADSAGGGPRVNEFLLLSILPVVQSGDNIIPSLFSSLQQGENSRPDNSVVCVHKHKVITSGRVYSKVAGFSLSLIFGMEHMNAPILP